MSFREPILHFSDILDATFWIEQYILGLSFDDYERDIKTKDAVERRLQVVTEAVIRLGENAQTFSLEVDWHAWRGLGNFLRHGYHKIDDEIIWGKLYNELPLLKRTSLDALSRLKSGK